MKTNTVTNWKKKIALQIEIYARAIIELNDFCDFLKTVCSEINLYK